ncbi:hypothetical protein BGC07_03620 [Piscirickettsia litoralis]|uniref:Uncharacterized protein n=1 Tax=Piscirickettsia litoralis TaxID=1891921 RepID=A0ABX3A011_9GAMM|nr:hypothetical protein BGC07_03620 [Piscirickettsia litoralis]
MSASKTKKRQTYAFFSEPYRSEKMVLFSYRGNTKLASITHIYDLINYSFKLGTTRGYFMAINFQRFKKTSKATQN